MPLSIDNVTRLAMPLAIEQCRDHPYYAFGDTLWRIGTLLCIIVGMPGHILVVTIMLNPRNRRQPVCLYFATIAVFEFAYLSSRFTHPRFGRSSDSNLFREQILQGKG